MVDEHGGEPLSRRRMLALAGTGLTAGIAGCTGGGDPETTETAEPTTTTTQEPAEFAVPEGGAHFGIEDGFASVGDWVEDAAVYTVTEPTREALNAAVNNPEPRIVVFETSGTIDLGEADLNISFDKCWIAGQTAPSPGITLTRGGFWVNANDCVVQHLRVRPGDAGNESDWEPDTIRTNDETENNIIDHCSATWSVDENVSPGYDSVKTTFSNCIVAEPLHDASHHKGPHSYNMLVGNGATEVAIMGNVFANSTSRNPRLKAETESAVVNNLMYDFGEAVNLDDSTVTSLVGNSFKRVDVGDANVEGGEGYIEDNITNPETPMTKGFKEYAGKAIWPLELEAMDAAKGEEHALTYAGARPADRTEHDTRVIENVRNGEGEIIDSQDEVGGYPELAENTHELNVPDSDRRDWLAAWAVAVEEEDVEVPSA